MNKSIIPSLSIIIISRNEAKNIARAIESVICSVENIPKNEIMLVDSASTDETVAIASQYPINILRLKSSWFLSAAAGRYVGMCNTKGDLIFYLDGDMELIPEWLDYAIPILWDNPRTAGVAGYRRDMYIKNGHIVHEHNKYWNTEGCSTVVGAFEGSALYRRSALEQVGGFNPYLCSDEEPELGMRLRNAGYDLISLPRLMCKNYTLPINSWDYWVRNFRRGLLAGRGQVLRYHLGTGLFWQSLWERASDILFFTIGIATVVSIVWSLAFRNILFPVVLGIIILSVLVTYWIKKRSLKKTLMSIIGRLFIVYGIIRGFIMSHKSPLDYPTQAEVIQTKCHQ